MYFPSKDLILDLAFLRENTGQQKVAFTHVLCSDLSLVANRIKDIDFKFNTLVIQSLKTGRIHDMKSNATI